MDDKEMIGLAGKAAGMQLNDDGSIPEWIIFDACPDPKYQRRWDPLSDDGDALRLAVKLGLRVDMNYRPNPKSCVGVGVSMPTDSEFYPPFWQSYAKDPALVVRRTIVRAAAEIGKAMP